MVSSRISLQEIKLRVNLMSKAKVLIAILVLMFPSFGYPSEEEFVIWKKVEIVSDSYTDREKVGDVIFKAELNDDLLYQSMSVTAFGKEFQILRDDLGKFNPFPVSSLLITHEAGFTQLGGHRVHFKMERTDYSPNQERTKQAVKAQIIISVNETDDAYKIDHR